LFEQVALRSQNSSYWLDCL